jgi:hypothetical protein
MAKLIMTRTRPDSAKAAYDVAAYAWPAELTNLRHAHWDTLAVLYFRVNPHLRF